MNKTELIADIAEKTGVAEADCLKVIEAFEAIMSEQAEHHGGALDALTKIIDMMKK